MKVVINDCFGGFSLSKDAYEYMGIPWDRYGFHFNDKSKRTDPKLIEAVETLGAKANGFCAELKVVEIPDDVEWEIDEYDGNETIEEKHRSWN